MRRPALENNSRPERDMVKPADVTTTTTTEEQSEREHENPTLDSKYRLILIAAQRSKQLQRGARPRVEMDTLRHKPTRIALEEVHRGVVNFSIIEQE
jgi:DNA-directed RNA polymerase omega subunit